MNFCAKYSILYINPWQEKKKHIYVTRIFFLPNCDLVIPLDLNRIIKESVDIGK